MTTSPPDPPVERRLHPAAYADAIVLDRGGRFFGYRIRRFRRFGRIGLFAEIAFGAVDGRAHVVRVGQTEIVVEALAARKEFGLIAEVPFADSGGRVPGGAKDVGDRVFVGMEADGGVGK